jgi:hypothetical protein
MSERTGNQFGCWTDDLRAKPPEWLLEENAPAVPHLTLTRLLDYPATDRDVVVAYLREAIALRALLGFGWLDDPRVQRAITWQARIATGEGGVRYYASGANGPGYCCAANDKLPCAWGATKALLAFARIPPERRTPVVERAIERGVQLLLSVDPATAAYPMGYGNTRPNGSWFELGFPSGYVADVLQVLEALCQPGYGGDPRLQHALDWLLQKQDAQGRWRNEYAYSGKLWSDIDTQGQPSKWVTLRACRVLKVVHAQGGKV